MLLYKNYKAIQKLHIFEYKLVGLLEVKPKYAIISNQYNFHLLGAYIIYNVMFIIILVLLNRKVSLQVFNTIILILIFIVKEM